MGRIRWTCFDFIRGHSNVSTIPKLWTHLRGLWGCLAEIGGGYLVWLWLREKKHFIVGVVGGIILVLYGVIPTLQDYLNFGRVYAVYGGIFIVLSLFWGWGIDKKKPDRYDWLGASIALIGVAIIIWMPR